LVQTSTVVAGSMDAHSMDGVVEPNVLLLA
jgi:hypothetical protein